MIFQYEEYNGISIKMIFGYAADEEVFMRKDKLFKVAAKDLKWGISQGGHVDDEFSDLSHKKNFLRISQYGFIYKTVTFHSF